MNARSTRRIADHKRQMNDHRAKAEGALRAMTRHALQRCQTQPEEARAWRALCEAVARYAERGNPIERALGLYAVQRMALHGAELLERVEAESYGSYLSSHAREQERKAGLTDEEIRETAAGIISRFESARDVTVFGLYSMGKSVRQVARALRVSVGTVHYALTRIEGMGIRIIRRSGGGGSHAGNAYRQNGRLRYRSHTSEVERADRDETSE